MSPSTALAPLCLFVACLVVLRTSSRAPLPDFLRSTASPPRAPILRTGHNILYWKQHKTGSTSARYWLQSLATKAGLHYKFVPSVNYRFKPPTDLSTRIGTRNCTVLVGHIFTRSAHARAHEAARGAVVATTRDVLSYLCSRYFYAAESTYADVAAALEKPMSGSSRLWWTRWLMYDKCEAFRYYDGVDGCDVSPSALRDRAEAIAARLDCVIDTDHPQPDADAICRAVGVRDCPVFGELNSKGAGGYDNLLALPHIKQSLEQPAYVVGFLREAMMKRRCRFLPVRDGATMGDLPPAKWPTTACRAKA